MANKTYGFYFELEFPQEMNPDEIYEQGQAYVSTDLKDWDEVDKLIFRRSVHVVIHLHRGVIFNTAVFKDAEKAKQYRDEQVKEQYGELVERQEGDDLIDLQECQVIN